eukprot:scaffold13347_cov132-Isochrysis_galbana.AAC.2
MPDLPITRRTSGHSLYCIRLPQMLLAACLRPARGDARKDGRYGLGWPLPSGTVADRSIFVLCVALQTAGITNHTALPESKGPDGLTP